MKIQNFNLNDIIYNAYLLFFDVCERNQLELLIRMYKKLNPNTPVFLIGTQRAPTQRESIPHNTIEEIIKSLNCKYYECDLLLPRYTNKENNQAYCRVEEIIFSVIKNICGKTENMTALEELKKSLINSTNIFLGYNRVNIPWAMASNKIRVIDVRGTNLNQNVISEHFTRLSNLNKLFLQNNGLISFPAILSQLKKLEVLDISKNKITTIDNYDFPSLTELNASFNSLTSFDLWGSKLKILDLLGNKIKNLPLNIDELCPNLKYLNIAFNSITSLPNTMGFMISLKELFVNGNILKNFPYEIIGRGAGAILNYLRGDFIF
jgi:hypothetical protein